MGVGPIRLEYVHRVTITALSDNEAVIAREWVYGDSLDDKPATIELEAFTHAPRLGDVYLETRTWQSGSTQWTLFLLGNTGARLRPSLMPEG